MESFMSTLIIGAGITGIYLARGIDNSIILEKSRGVGGRIATRRTNLAQFDHGAQFYSLKSSMLDLHNHWQAQGLSQFWFQKDQVDRFMAPNGMTSLAKSLAENIDIRLEHKVERIELDSLGFKLFIENKNTMKCERLILTCPLPQALELLSKSSISFRAELSQILYAKALVGLFEKVSCDPSVLNQVGYLECPEGSQIFSIADQSKKSLKQESAWTVTMNADFSEQYFERDETLTLEKIVAELILFNSRFQFQNAQLKKWRYSHPLATVSKAFEQVAKNLYLAGDAFGSPSLNGAVASAKSLLTQLNATSTHF
jgi:renalase